MSTAINNIPTRAMHRVYRVLQVVRRANQTSFEIRYFS